ncbi:MAG: hypothetical protein R3A50_12075 [Saprospiraceae bacterium]|nr:hypothetical protein [Saprospiraceae bacterium]MCB9343543.1 hypothetical protein [Lewinellaceae bacterium]
MKTILFLCMRPFMGFTLLVGLVFAFAPLFCLTILAVALSCCFRKKSAQLS